MTTLTNKPRTKALKSFHKERKKEKGNSEPLKESTTLVIVFSEKIPSGDWEHCPFAELDNYEEIKIKQITDWVMVTSVRGRQRGHQKQ